MDDLENKVLTSTTFQSTVLYEKSDTTTAAYMTYLLAYLKQPMAKHSLYYVCDTAMDGRRPTEIVCTIELKSKLCLKIFKYPNAANKTHYNKKLKQIQITQN